MKDEDYSFITLKTGNRVRDIVLSFIAVGLFAFVTYTYTNYGAGSKGNGGEEVKVTESEAAKEKGKEEEEEGNTTATPTAASVSPRAYAPIVSPRTRSATTAAREQYERDFMARFPRYNAKLTADEVALYFGSYSIDFARVDGSTVCAGPTALADNKETRLKAKSRLQPVGVVGGGNIYVPGVPCADPLVTKQPSSASIPPALRKPLLKVKSSHPTIFKDIRGIRSGGRSAVVLIDGWGYRLKGCGNYVDGDYGGKSLKFAYPGLPIAKMAADDHVPDSGKIVDFINVTCDPSAVEVRGCMFEHTSFREIHMSALIDSLLKTENKLSAISPVGYWQYQLGEDDPAPSVGKYCSIYRTMGERRLASHLLVGLEMLLPLLIPGIDSKTALGLLPKERREKYTYQDKNKVKKTMAFIPTEVALGKSLHQGRIKSEVFENYDFEPTDCRSCDIAEVPPNYPEFSHLMHFWSTTEKKNVYNFEALWNEAKDKLRETLRVRSEGKVKGSVMAELYYRLGREVGEFNKLLANNNISWGYFTDHFLEPHNNNHPNNFIVLPQGFNCILAPLDFDMAFQEKEYFDLFSAAVESSNSTRKDFATNMKFERHAMEQALAGRVDSTGLAGIEPTVKEVEERYQIVRCLLRDTMMCGYREGFIKGSQDRPYHAESDQAHYSLIKMALILSSHRYS